MIILLLVCCLTPGWSEEADPNGIESEQRVIEPQPQPEPQEQEQEPEFLEPQEEPEPQEQEQEPEFLEPREEPARPERFEPGMFPRTDMPAMRQDPARARRGGFGEATPRLARPGESPDDPNSLEAVNLNNVEMRNIIQKIAEWTNKPVIPTSDEIMQTRVTIFSPIRLPRDQALSLLGVALRARGVIIDIQEERVLLRPLASVRIGSVPTLGPEEPLARYTDKNQIVEKWFQLKNYSPSKLIQIISPLTAEYGYSAADEGTYRVVVIDTIENLMRIERLIQQLDVPESLLEIENIFQLEHADPQEVVQVLELILSQRTQTGRQAVATQPVATGGGGGGARGRDAQSGISVVIPGATVPIRLIPMPKQRWILARAAREDMARITEWISKLDIIDTADLRQTVVQVRHANVQEVVRMVQNTLRDMPGTSLASNLVVEALPQSGQIVIYGSEANRTMAERLIAEIDLPKENLFIERSFRLKHADPDEIKRHIEALYSGQPQNALTMALTRTATAVQQMRPEDTVKVIAYQTLKQITIIASPQNMEKISRQIAEEWDVPMDIESDQYRVIFLHNSDPVQMANLLKRLFSDSSGSDATNLTRMLFGGVTDTRQSIVGSLYGVLTFEPVPDSKKMIVISKIPEAYDVIERLIEKLDRQEMAEVPRVITLQYADPEALCDQLNSILNEAGTLSTIQRSARGLSSYNPNSDSGAMQAVGSDSAGTITPWWTRQRLDTTQVPPSNLIGRVRFVPVHRSKSILVVSPPEFMDEINAMIKELDQPGMQVMVKVIIVEINLSDATSLGVQLASNPTAFGTLGVNALTALNRLTYADAGSAYTFSTSTDIHLLVDLLVKQANGRVLNQPTLWTKDNEEAIFIKGEKIAFIAGDTTDRQNPSAITRTFNYENVGVTLRVRPNITPEKAVDMTINLNISQVMPVLVNTQVARKNLDTTTHMIVNDGQSVMLGGILFRNDDEYVQKVPLLGDLPLVGGLFRHTRKALANEELLVFVTPHVIDDNLLADIPVDETSKQYLEESTWKKDYVLEELAEVLSKSWGELMGESAVE